MNITKSCWMSKPARRAFSLLELLAVMAIMAILLTATLPMIAGLNESNNISQGGQLFADQVALARQIASARNETVEIRCINDTNLAPNGFSAIQLWATATGVPISRVQKFPDGVVISQDKNKVSTLFASFASSNVMPTTNNAGALAGASYQSFTVSPSGLVGPLNTNTVNPVVPDMTNLYVGIVPERFATQAYLPTNNYMLVQLNPLTGATVNYRP